MLSLLSNCRFFQTFAQRMFCNSQSIFLINQTFTSWETSKPIKTELVKLKLIYDTFVIEFVSQISNFSIFIQNFFISEKCKIDLPFSFLVFQNLSGFKQPFLLFHKQVKKMLCMQCLEKSKISILLNFSTLIEIVTNSSNFF